MKNFMYILIILLMILSACSTQTAKAQTSNKQNLINNSFNGEKLLSNKEFVLSVNRTCDNTESKLCTVGKIKKDYFSKFSNLNNDEIIISKLKDNIVLKLKKEKRKKNQNEFSMVIKLISYKNNKKVDSIICYESKNDPNYSTASEKLYYLKDYYLWTLIFIYDLESTTAFDWNKYKINLRTGKFELIDNLKLE